MAVVAINIVTSAKAVTSLTRDGMLLSSEFLEVWFLAEVFFAPD